MLYRALLVALLPLAACAADPTTTSEASGTADQNADGVIFPPDSPHESCDLGTDLTCESMVNFNLTTKTSLKTGATQSRAISVTAAAAISEDGRSMHCQPASNIDTFNVTGYSIYIPNGTTYSETNDGTAVVFSPTINSLNLVPPNPNGMFGAKTCGLVCDGESPQSNFKDGCQPFYRDTLDDGSIRIDGQTRTVELNGRIQALDYDDQTGLLQQTCSLSLMPKNVRTQIVTRPDDVIATSRGRFVRGYELTGSALTNACASLASKTCVCTGQRCDGLGQCIEDYTDSCVEAFSQPDPCIRRDPEDPR
jgi:hypothetical protein